MTPNTTWSQNSRRSRLLCTDATPIRTFHHQVCQPTLLCYSPGTDSWWITFRITASQQDWLSAVSAMIDLPSCGRMISEACFSSLPQQSVLGLISAPKTKRQNYPVSSLHFPYNILKLRHSPWILQLRQLLTKLSPACCIKHDECAIQAQYSSDVRGARHA